MIHRRALLTSAGSALAGAIAAPYAVAQATKTTRLVVGFAAGGSTDVIARLLATQLQRSGTPHIVDNKAGAAGRLAVVDVRNAPPDGHSILVTPDPMMTVYPLVYRKLNYDPVADFRPVSMIASAPMGLAVGPLVPGSVKTLADFTAWLKANPDKASYGTAGAGTTLHFIGEMFGRANNATFEHVAYRGGALAAQDVMGGQIAACINVISEQLPLVSTGKLRILAVSSAKRSKFLPDVQAFAEAGYRDLESFAWFGSFVPAKTPDAVVKKLNAAIVEAARAPDVVLGLEKLGYEVAAGSPEALGQLLQADIERWAPIVKVSGYKADE